MADLFYAVLIIWVLWRIFGSTTRTTVHYHQHHQKPERREGEVTITSVPKPDQDKGSDRGEYVDYEEVK